MRDVRSMGSTVAFAVPPTRSTGGDWSVPPVVSVVVSTRNHANYLGDLLDGVEAQLFGPIELILVDNASTDSTVVTVKDFLAGTARAVTYVRLADDYGPAVGRSVGVELARGEYVAFTDADCIPSPEWLSAALSAFDSRGVGVVQGRTECREASAPLFSHFIETRRFDGSFSTSNVVYRRAALGAQRFDRRCVYWEDTDLGFRVVGSGWEARYASDALVHHQVVVQSPLAWLLWPVRYANWPAKASRYPRFRQSLFLRVWVSPLHACFDAAVLGVVAAVLGKRRLGPLMTLPYAVAFGRTRGIAGRLPVLKIVLYVIRDGIALAALCVGSVRNREVVL